MGFKVEMTENQDSNADHEIDFADPPEGLEIAELIAKQRFRIREIVPLSGRVVGALILLAGIAFLIVLITQVSLIDEYLKEKLGSVPVLIPQLVRILMIVAVVTLSFQMLRQLFGMTELQGSMNTITGRTNYSSDVESRYPGRWEVRMVGTGGLLKFYKTESLEEAKWLSRFVAEWYGLEVELTGDDRKIGF